MSFLATPAYVKLERVTRVGALGMQFYDTVRQRIIADLHVTARWRAASPGGSRRQPRVLFPGPSGVFVLHTSANDWPALEAQAIDNTFWNQLPPAREAIVAVVDPAGRYLPFTFTAAVPQPGPHPGGLFAPDCLLASPPTLSWPPNAIPLFPAPAAPVPEGVAAVRADLWDLATDRAAAGAVLEVIYDGLVVGRGVADDRGVALAVVPYPAPIDFTADSPGTGESAWLQRWSVEISVAWRATAPLWQPEPGGSQLQLQYLDLCGALRQLGQPRATAWASRSPNQFFTNATLRLSKDLILSTVVSGAATPQLLITPEP